MSACPDDDVFQRFLRAQLDVSKQVELAAHVEGCRYCQERTSAPASPGPAAAPPPVRVDEYELMHLLGRGAMGEVHLARDTRLDRQVAIKFLVAPSQVGAERMLREARAVARVHHPNVVAVHRVGEVEGRPYLVTEHIEGHTLAELPLPVAHEHARELALQVARGLAAAHQQHVLHRDLKPANVMLSKSGVAKLLDFGLAKETADASSPLSSATDMRLTQTGALVGTPRYLAPELWAGGPATAQSDFWAFGTMLYELLCGVPPYDAGSARELQTKVLLGASQPLRERAPSVPESLVAVVDRCLARAPEQRFGSAQELIAALEARPKRGARPVAWLAAAAAAACALSAGGWWWTGALPAGERRISIACLPRTGDDGFLADATCALARRRLCQAPLPYRCDAPANTAVVLSVHREPKGVGLALSLGPAWGRLTRVEALTAASVIDGLEQLSEAAQRHLGDGRPPLETSAAELDTAKQLGTASVEALRAYERAIALSLEVIHTDEVAVDAQLERVLSIDEGWAHPWVMRLIQQKMFGERAEATYAQARAAVTDATRDPAGSAMLLALGQIRDQKIAEATESLSPLLERYPRDPVLGYLHALTLYFQRLPEESIGATRRLADRWPELQFGSDLVSQLFEAGRRAELEGFAAQWLARAPGSEQPLLLAMAIAVEHERAARVQQLGSDYLLLHGEAPHRWTRMCDALIGAGLLEEAHVFADRLVASTGLPHGEGLQRAGVLAILEGRFLAAEQALSAAVVALEATGTNEGARALQALASVQRLVGEEQAARATSERLAAAFGRYRMPDYEAVVRYELALQAGGCPAPDAFVEPLKPGPARGEALIAMRRAAAAASCGSCAEVLRQGFSAAERSTTSMVHFARCAVTEEKLAAAEEALTRAVLFSPDLSHGMTRFSPVDGMLARYLLAGVLEKQGRRAEALARYRQFLKGWSGAEAQVPEVREARAAVARLESAPH